MTNDLGEKLRILRESRNLTRKQVGEYLDKSSNAVKYYEINQVVPPINILKRLAEFYHVKVDYLLGLDNIPRLTMEGIPHDKSLILAEIDYLLIRLLE